MSGRRKLTGKKVAAAALPEDVLRDDNYSNPINDKAMMRVKMIDKDKHPEIYAADNARTYFDVAKGIIYEAYLLKQKKTYTEEVVTVVSTYTNDDAGALALARDMEDFANDLSRRTLMGTLLKGVDNLDVVDSKKIQSALGK
jgi:hypothetical protein